MPLHMLCVSFLWGEFITPVTSSVFSIHSYLFLCDFFCRTLAGGPRLRATPPQRSTAALIVAARAAVDGCGHRFPPLVWREPPEEQGEGGGGGQGRPRGGMRSSSLARTMTEDPGLHPKSRLSPRRKISSVRDDVVRHALHRRARVSQESSSLVKEHFAVGAFKSLRTHASRHSGMHRCFSQSGFAVIHMKMFPLPTHVDKLVELVRRFRPRVAMTQFPSQLHFVHTHRPVDRFAHKATTSCQGGGRNGRCAWGGCFGGKQVDATRGYSEAVNLNYTRFPWQAVFSTSLAFAYLMSASAWSLDDQSRLVDQMNLVVPSM